MVAGRGPGAAAVEAMSQTPGRGDREMSFLLTAAAALALAFLVGDFAGRLQRRIDRLRGVEREGRGCALPVSVALAILLLSWMLVARL